jgi:hypothetical protein
MKFNIKNINDSFNNKMIPNILDYTINESDNSLDWSKVTYNDHYKSFDYFSNKFPNGWQSIPGFENIIKDIANNTLSPLEEMNKLIARSEYLRLEKIEKYNNESYERNSINSEWFSLETFDFIFKK